MTSAPVKSVNSLMNFVGTRPAAPNSKGVDNGFGSAMSKATGENSNSDAGGQTVLSRNANNTSPSEVSRNISDTRRGDVVKESRVPQSVDNPLQQMEETGKELVGEVAEMFGVTEEEVLDAMEVLGLSYISLFEPGSLQELILQISGEEDASALLTNEGLFQNLQTMQKLANNMQQELMQEMNLSPEEMQQILEEAQKTPADIPADTGDAGIPVNTPMEEVAEQPHITIDVKVNGEDVKMEADADGNVTKTLEVAPREVQNHSEDRQQSSMEKGNEKEPHSETSLHSDNVMLNSVLQEKVSVEDTSFAQSISNFDRNTQEIMDQILNYMKIQLKPGMDQLEMQLHPESLGTVHIQLTSKAGELTAEFHVQNESVKAALESQIAELKDNLKEQGIKVEAVEVSVDTKGFESNLWQGQERQESYEGNKKSPRRINLNQLDALFEEEASEEELLNARVMQMNGSTVDYTA